MDGPSDACFSWLLMNRPDHEVGFEHANGEAGKVVMYFPGQADWARLFLSPKLGRRADSASCGDDYPFWVARRE
jgi:hypothetical protein